MRQHKGCFTCVEFHVACSSIFDLFSLSVFYGKFIWKHTQSRVICHLSIPSAHLFSSAFLSSFSRSLFSSSSLSPKSCPSHLFLLYVLLFLFFISSFLLLSIKNVSSYSPSTYLLSTFSQSSVSAESSSPSCCYFNLNLIWICASAFWVSPPPPLWVNYRASVGQLTSWPWDKAVSQSYWGGGVVLKETENTYLLACGLWFLILFNRF